MSALLSPIPCCLDDLRTESDTSETSKEPAGITSLPQELFDEVLRMLSNRDVVSIRCSCRKLSIMGRHNLMCRLTVSRKYHWTRVDLEALISFAKESCHNFDPSVRLRHLVIEVYPPYIDPSPPLVAPPPPLEIPFTDNELGRFHQILNWAYDAYPSETRSSEDLEGLFAEAIMLLPDIERIDIASPGSHTRISGKVVLSHYREYIKKAFRDSHDWQISPRYRLWIGNRFLKFYRQYSGSRKTPDGILTRKYPGLKPSFGSTVFKSVLKSFRVFKSDRPKLTSLCYLRTDRRDGYIPNRWFRDDVDGSDYIRVDFYQPVISNLNNLVVHFQRPPLIDIFHVKRSVEQITSYQKNVAKFLLHPRQLVGLSIFFNDIAWTEEVKLLDDLYLPYVPSIRLISLSASEGHLLFLRNFHLDTLAFKSDDIIKFLVDRKGTLADVGFVNCVLQAPRQSWQPVFRALESLSLYLFNYSSTDARMAENRDERGVSYCPAAISWFRVVGKIATEEHYCELLPKGYHTRAPGCEENPLMRTNYENAMKAIQVMESVVILGNPVKTHLEAFVQKNATIQHPGSVMPYRPLKGQWDEGPVEYYKLLPINPYLVTDTLIFMERIMAAGFDYDDPLLDIGRLPPEGLDG
ncbi:hypothetical protein TWF192_006705 [Orbilia oligospora]|uniref:F-box domain-containing protein n=1 Tax=Orbilia oligospora TaxID=2813651 RepID=A0A6G1M713_ORBOL|nr:hypothetical protein TWF679_007880 [Orbilia oligospora]KAF3227198.1 hypothetical protein TWF191_004068 [Orbilia oligospora]KAF3246892.1 hypothetical protein TWF192_006705 [Orbilia oligospora]